MQAMQKGTWERGGQVLRRLGGWEVGSPNANSVISFWKTAL